MRDTDTHEEMEKALLGLMPVALSEAAQASMEAKVDELAAAAQTVRFDSGRIARWALGAAASAALGIFAVSSYGDKDSPQSAGTRDAGVDEDLVVLAETDRVETISDSGLFVDAEGSAVRKLNVRVVGEKKIRDCKTGIELTLTSPREETYLVPVSTF